MTSKEILETKCYDLYHKIGNPCFCVDHFPKNVNQLYVLIMQMLTLTLNINNLMKID